MSDLVTLHDLPSIDSTVLEPIDFEALAGPESPSHAPLILILCGSFRTRSYSRLLAEEAARL